MLTDIHNDLCSIYASNHFGPICKSIRVIEKEKKAKVKFVTIKTESQLFQIKNSFLKAGGSRYDNGEVISTSDLGHDCDGAFFVEKDGKNYLVMLELKSSYSKDSLCKAKKQFLSSFHNLMSELHGLINYNPTDVKVCCMLASHPLKTEEMVKFLKWKYDGNGLDGYATRAIHYAMHPEDYTIFYKSEDRTIDAAPLRESHLFSEAPMFHLPVPENSESGIFNIDKLLSKI